MHAVPRKRTPPEEEDEGPPPGPPPIGQPALFSLRLGWAGLLLVSAVLWVLGYRFVQGWWQAEYAARWMILSGLGLGTFLWWLWRAMPENRRPGEEALLPRMGLAAGLTFWRAVLILALLGFLISPQPPGWQAWLPGIFFTAAMLLRPLAGFLGRREKKITCLGEKLQVMVDLASLLTGTLLVVQYGQAPWWYLLVALGHALLLAGAWLRQRRELPFYPLRRSGLHRILAALEYAFLSLMLLPLFSPPVTTWAASVVMLALLLRQWKDWQFIAGAGKGAPVSND